MCYRAGEVGTRHESAGDCPRLPLPDASAFDIASGNEAGYPPSQTSAVAALRPEVWIDQPETLNRSRGSNIYDQACGNVTAGFCRVQYPEPVADDLGGQGCVVPGSVDQSPPERMKRVAGVVDVVEQLVADARCLNGCGRIVVVVARRATSVRHRVGIGRGPCRLAPSPSGQVDRSTVAVKVLMDRPELEPGANLYETVIVKVVVNQHGRRSLCSRVVEITGKRRQSQQQNACANKN